MCVYKKFMMHSPNQQHQFCDYLTTNKVLWFHIAFTASQGDVLANSSLIGNLVCLASIEGFKSLFSNHLLESVNYQHRGHNQLQNWSSVLKFHYRGGSASIPHKLYVASEGIVLCVTSLMELWQRDFPTEIWIFCLTRNIIYHENIKAKYYTFENY